MLKFKKIFMILFIYFIIMLFYIFFMKAENITIDFFYTNIIFIIIYLIIANFFIEPNKVFNFKLYRYNDKLSFLREEIKVYSINIFTIFMCVSILNCIILLIKQGYFDIIKSLYYFLNIFLIIYIAYMCILSFAFKKQIKQLRYIIFIILLSMFYFGTFDIGITPINIFKYISYPGTWYEILVHYMVWILGAYILIDYNSKRVEI